MKIITKTSSETQNFGEDFAKKLRGEEILALVGDLGSGKTTFVQGLARGLGIKQRIISPTFILIRQYIVTAPNISLKRGRLAKLKFYHVDLYRLEGDLSDEFKNLGLNEIWGRKENIVAIEWAEKIKNLLPQNTIWMKFEALSDDAHCISYINI